VTKHTLHRDCGEVASQSSGSLYQGNAHFPII
jgi:hypothetical protein